VRRTLLAYHGSLPAGIRGNPRRNFRDHVSGREFAGVRERWLDTIDRLRTCHWKEESPMTVVAVSVFRSSSVGCRAER